jgi:hypothetical protein
MGTNRDHWDFWVEAEPTTNLSMHSGQERGNMWITIDLKLLTRFITTAAKNKIKKNRKSSGNFEFQGTRQAAQCCPWHK